MNIFKIIFYFKFLLYTIIDVLILTIHYKNNIKKIDSLVIVKTDNIGDYVLFRNFLSEIKKIKKFKDTKITLIGNEAYKDMALKFDKRYVDNFIWVNNKKFRGNIFYRINLLFKLKNNNYRYLLNAMYSRDFFTSDWISKWIYSDKKIAFNGDLINQYDFQRKYSDNWYDSLVTSNTKNNIFEFYRYKNFFEFFFKKKINIKKTYFKNFNFNKISKFKLKNYICLFIDAGEKEKKYSIDNFLKIAQLIIKNTNYKIVILGGKEFNNFPSLDRKYYKNLLGKTTLEELVLIIKNSKLLISNDSCAQHIAAATDTKCIVIYAGLQLNRFLPYPKRHYPNHITVVHHLKKKNRQKKSNQEKLNNKYELDINDIKIEEIKKSIKFLLKKNIKL